MARFVPLRKSIYLKDVIDRDKMALVELTVGDSGTGSSYGRSGVLSKSAYCQLDLSEICPSQSKVVDYAADTNLQRTGFWKSPAQRILGRGSNELHVYECACWYLNTNALPW